jgi:N-acyl homoserine lactone hydrolase
MAGIRAFSAALALVFSLGAANAAGLQRLYVLDCGWALGKDQARWSPGVNEGKPIELSDNCYLVKHESGLLLWDTGIPDAVHGKSEGVPVANGAIVYHRDKTLAGQLAELGVKPEDIAYVAISHTHGDHVGNVALFPAATILIQGAEYEFGLKMPQPPQFQPSQKIEKLAGDRDVFGDGSVMLLSTPGHTPGHQSLMLTLPKTGVVLLSGDAVHFKDNWDHKRVPSMNVDRDQTLASLQRLENVMAEKKAQLWINHDKAQSAGIPHAPQYLE